MQIQVTYPVQELFIQYHEGQNDPLYAVLSRAFASLCTGRSYRYETKLEASKEEIDRLIDVANEIEACEPDNQEMINSFVRALADVAYPDKQIPCLACQGKGCLECEGTGEQQAVYSFQEGSYMAYTPGSGQREYVD